MSFGGKIGVKAGKFFKILGPGMVTGASDDDPNYTIHNRDCKKYR